MVYTERRIKDPQLRSVPSTRDKSALAAMNNIVVNPEEPSIGGICGLAVKHGWLSKNLKRITLKYELHVPINRDHEGMNFTKQKISVDPFNQRHQCSPFFIPEHSGSVVSIFNYYYLSLPSFLPYRSKKVISFYFKFYSKPCVPFLNQPIDDT